MLDEFDIGPLTWVKDEIDQALNSVLENISAIASQGQDVASLRFSQTHLYQVSGALDMVGLEGCKRYCSELEKLAGKLEKQVVAASPEALALLSDSVSKLGAYLQNLLHGAPDQPLTLFPSLQAMAKLQGEGVEESELFFPDSEIPAPKNLPAKAVDAAALPAYIAEQRAAFQKSLLSWLKNQTAEGLAQMTAAIDNVLEAQPQKQKALWWAAAALMDALSQPALAANAGAKKLCRRLDQQLRSLSEGASRASGNLLRDVLYYVAISEASSERIAQIKAHFELDRFLPDAGAAAVASIEVSAEEAAAVEQLKAALEPLKDSWAAISDGASKSLDDFLQQLGTVIEPSQGLTSTTVAGLFGSIHEFVTALTLDASKINEQGLLEVATGLTLLEDALQSYGKPNKELMQRMELQTQRLQDMLGGGPMADLSGAPMSDQLDSEVLRAVANQIKDALKLSEQGLDTFFRNPTERRVLESVVKPLQQVSAAFLMLDMPVPAAVADTSLGLIEGFAQQAGESQQSQFELVAESLSMLDFYAAELPRVRPESLQALESALQRLQQAATPAAASEAVVDAPPAVTVEQAAGAAVTDRALDPELLDIYLTEAEEVLANIAQNLQSLRVNATDPEALVEVRRGFHTLKGSGRTVGLTALGEVAWGIEKLLNLLMERKTAPSQTQLGLMEETSAAFAEWVAVLREHGEVTLDAASWQQRAAALENEAETPPPSAAEVLIGGTRKMSRGLFNIFIAEAEQHMQTLQQAAAALSAGEPAKPDEASVRAAHTLASNAGTAGFKAMGDLARALEHWFDVHPGHWTEQGVSLLRNVLGVLSEMLGEARELRPPKQNSSLLAALNEAMLHANLAAPSAEASGGVPPQLDMHVAEFPVEEPPALAAGAMVVEEVPMAALEEAAESAPMPPQESPVAKKSRSGGKKSEQPAAVEQELLTMFIEEARELVPQVGNELRAWRANPQETDHPDTLQRALHTLKGSARMAGQAALGDTVHGMEDRIIRALKGKVGAADFDDMFLDLDRIGAQLEEVLGVAGVGRGGEAEKAVVATPGRAADRRAQYLRVRADVLDRLINEAGEISIARSRMQREMQGFKQFSLDLTESVFRLRNHLRELEIEAESQLQSRMTQLEESNATFDPLEFDRFTRLQELTRMMAESVNDVATIQHGLLMNLDETESALQQQNRMNRELQHGLMDVRMVPFSLISERLQRIVRQTARELDKLVEMQIDGEDEEIDRSVLDKIGAPLEHLLRNAVAHGMETPAQRKKVGKPESGGITLKVRQENDEIMLAVSDDGAGINLQRVREKAVEQGLLSPDQEIGEQALMAIIFEPGFSTAASVSQIAGRGVGLDAVRSDIAALGGRIDVSSTPGQGALFTIYLPVTLSVAQAVLVRAGNKTFALPAVMIEQVQKLKPDGLAAAYETGSIEWSGRNYPLHFLGRLTGDIEQPAEEQRYTPLILLRSGAYRIALHVDDIIGNQEVVMKPIGPQLARVPGIIGATVMGDGSIILLINAVQLANRELLSVGSVKLASQAPEETDDRTTVMVVDDSLTMRKVLGRLLEREGYRVVTAKDGMDALQQLQEVLPDIILTDIEMPRMDGFELARNVRDDARTARIPLIVISSRTAEKHRNLAQEIGVDAYLGKPVQDDELTTQISLLLGQAVPVTP